MSFISLVLVYPYESHAELTKSSYNISSTIAYPLLYRSLSYAISYSLCLAQRSIIYSSSGLVYISNAFYYPCTGIVVHILV